jgi:predicted nuclease with TOPRIM domain
VTDVVSKILEAIDEDIRRADSRIEASEKKVEEASQIFDDACRSLERAQAVVQETREGLTPLEDEKSLVTEKFGRNKGELLHVQVSSGFH